MLFSFFDLEQFRRSRERFEYERTSCSFSEFRCVRRSKAVRLTKWTGSLLIRQFLTFYKWFLQENINRVDRSSSSEKHLKFTIANFETCANSRNAEFISIRARKQDAQD